MDRLSRRTLGAAAVSGWRRRPRPRLTPRSGSSISDWAPSTARTRQSLPSARLRMRPGPWAISGASLRGAAVRDALRPQDCLYSLIENDGVAEVASVVGVVREALFAPEEGELAARPARGAGDPDRHAHRHREGLLPPPGDAAISTSTIRTSRATLRAQDPPRSTLGWLVRGLARRRAAGSGGLTVLCCDNMASNGRTLRRLVGQFAERVRSAGSPTWIEDQVRFPSSMVDRIVPAATPASLDHAAALLGLRDEAAVSAEGFAQWVIEDDFAAGRPAWEAAGAELVARRPALPGAEAAAAQWRALRHRLSRRPARPAVRRRCDGRSGARPLRRAADAGGDRTPHARRRPASTWMATPRPLLRRFANPSLRHRTLQIAMDGSQKIPVRWLPVLREARRRGAPARTSSWRSLPGSVSWRPRRGRPRAAARRPDGARLRAVVMPVADDPAALVRAALAIEEVFGRDLRQDAALVDELTTALARLTRAGARAALPG